MHKQDQGAARRAEHCIATTLLLSSEVEQMAIASEVAYQEVNNHTGKVLGQPSPFFLGTLINTLFEAGLKTCM